MATEKIKIRIPDPRRVFNAAFVPMITSKPETRKPLLIIEGGRGSGKSHGIVQYLVIEALKKRLRIALIRKVADTIRHSMYQEIKDLVQEWNLAQYFTFIDSRLEIQTANGTLFICKGLDKVEKTKSLAGIDIAWVEEATELTQNDWDTLRFSIRGDTDGVRQKILSFNRQAGSWTEKSFFNADLSFKEDPGTYHLHTTFRDNRFLDEAFLRDINQLRISDPELYKKVAEGLPIKLKGLIYQNWRVIEEFPSDCPEVIYGLDFGVSDPTVLVKIGIVGRSLFIDEVHYERGQTNQDLIEVLPELIENPTCEIYADNEDPNRIEEIFRAGYNIRPAEKGPNSVIEGIAFVRSFTMYVTARSTNLRKDLENYKWKVDKNGITVTPETPMHAFSHGPDAIRYPVFTHLLHPGVSLEDLENTEIVPMFSARIPGY